MNNNIRKAVPKDLNRCTEIRGLTRDNPIDRATLIAIGVTEEAWAIKLEKGEYIGVVAEEKGEIVGYCFGDTQTGEILVLALLPKYEGAGLGRHLLSKVMEELFSAGLSELWLAASSDPQIRAYGFYRHLGWQPSNTYDDNGDEILTYFKI
ncbi:GNAT family N-acetyltransferase [Rhodohalobacter mucosus]|uniref:GNAT family N-acetyltransferase n=2 Tax=Rhodohalobacter mucosus TaxID=2079485 RepID=A0A316TU43_9BACT|nr:GNAT family N-acetyltransferase [Rhodohalobacter mucosus]